MSHDPEIIQLSGTFTPLENGDDNSGYGYGDGDGDGYGSGRD
ncbi:hypothetical protein [Paracoccus sp. (in: a-proteobacteria)]